MRKYAILLVVFYFIVLTAGCTISHTFGPFMGKVVDAESGEPIEGAAVLIGFYIEVSSVGGTVYHFADAVEMLTDDRGEFKFAPKRVNLFKAMASWSDDNRISIFKPGYGAYPGNLKAYRSLDNRNSRLIPDDVHVTYYLPKLNTYADRKRNHYWIETPGNIDNEKMPNLRKLIEEDSDEILKMENL